MSAGLSAGWDQRDTARLYRAFEDRHPRYRPANASLVRHAALLPGHRVLDLAAGTGGTTAALLPLLGAQGRVDCVEPAAAMAAAGRERLGGDPRVGWLRSLDATAGPYDRIVCGAALWQWPDVSALFRQLALRLRAGGALVFNVPAAYLGEPDGAGGGRDPWLVDLLQCALQAYPAAAAQALKPPAPLHSATEISRALLDAGLQPVGWTHRQRLTQQAWCDWLKLPPIHSSWWPGIAADEAARRLDAAAASVDANSWRPESWRGWTAWKPAPALPAVRAGEASCADLPALAARDGALWLRGWLDPGRLARLHRQVLQAAQAEGLVDGRGRWYGPSAAAAHELPAWLAMQQRVARLDDFQALVHDPVLLRTVAAVAGAPVVGALGSVCRVAPPEGQVPATPAHRDGDYLARPVGVWTAWIPLADCAAEDGVLAVAAGSHRPGGVDDWRVQPLRRGDLLLFGAETLHRACPNLRRLRSRVSVDLRFGPATALAAGLPKPGLGAGV
jgi:SAM-dependent methyltransferase